MFFIKKVLYKRFLRKRSKRTKRLFFTRRKNARTKLLVNSFWNTLECYEKKKEKKKKFPSRRERKREKLIPTEKVVRS